MGTRAALLVAICLNRPKCSLARAATCFIPYLTPLAVAAFVDKIKLAKYAVIGSDSNQD